MMQYQKRPGQIRPSQSRSLTRSPPSKSPRVWVGVISQGDGDFLSEGGDFARGDFVWGDFAGGEATVFRDAKTHQQEI